MGMRARIKKRRAKRNNWDKEQKAKIADLRQESKVQKQYVGGSRLANKLITKGYDQGRKKAEAKAYGAVDEATNAANRANVANDTLSARFAGMAGDSARSAMERDKQGNEAFEGYSTDRANFQAGRSGILNNASALERSADTMVTDFQKTDAARFAADQEAAQRQAMSMARSSGSGALGMRQAIGAQAAAALQAQQQAGVTRANETNQLLNMQNEARAQAAGIRTGLSGQDISSANLAANTAQGMYGLGQGDRAATAASTGAQAGLVAANAANSMNAAQLGAQVGSAFRGSDTQAGLVTRNAQLGADTASEIARSENAMNDLLDAKQEKNPHRIGGKVISAIFDPGNIRGAADGECGWVQRSSKKA